MPPWPPARSRRSVRVPPAFIREGTGRQARAGGRRHRARASAASRAVRGVSFTVKDRTLHALIGPNGAGKTTAFNLISGMFPPDQGSVRLDGREVGGLSPQAITAAGIGRSFQITNLFPALTDRGECPPRHPGAPLRPLQHLDRGDGAPRHQPRYRRRSCAISASPASRRRKPARSPMAASASSTWRWRSPHARACCCWTSRWRASPRPSASASATSSRPFPATSRSSWWNMTSTACSNSPTTSP
ncbi:MAG: ATP-binding cassette domain-containing protein [Piscinibacter sp.]